LLNSVLAYRGKPASTNDVIAFFVALSHHDGNGSAIAEFVNDRTVANITKVFNFIFLLCSEILQAGNLIGAVALYFRPAGQAAGVFFAATRTLPR
jgi:hypothetical protein